MEDRLWARTQIETGSSRSTLNNGCMRASKCEHTGDLCIKQHWWSSHDTKTTQRYWSKLESRKGCWTSKMCKRGPSRWLSIRMPRQGGTTRKRRPSHLWKVSKRRDVVKTRERCAQYILLIWSLRQASGSDWGFPCGTRDTGALLKPKPLHR